MLTLHFILMFNKYILHQLMKRKLYTTTSHPHWCLTAPLLDKISDNIPRRSCKQLPLSQREVNIIMATTATQSMVINFILPHFLFWILRMEMIICWTQLAR